jgi:hypothetical protein
MGIVSLAIAVEEKSHSNIDGGQSIVSQDSLVGAASILLPCSRPTRVIAALGLTFLGQSDPRKTFAERFDDLGITLLRGPRIWRRD